MIDLAGQVFTRLTVIERAPSVRQGKSIRSRWLCRCECGAEVTVRTDGLTSGHSRSCGCLQREVVGSRDCAEDAHPQWAGASITYNSAHSRVRRKRGAAKHHPCIDCEGTAFEWSYVGNCPDEQTGVANGHPVRYCPYGNKHTECYVPRCVPCHRNHDQDRRAA